MVKKIVTWLLCFFLSYTSFAQRNMEYLDRGLLAIKVNNGVYINWRMLGTDPANISFNIYRGSTKVNSTPITETTNITDASGTAASSYTVRPIINGVEQAIEGSCTVWANQYLSIPLQLPSGGTTPDGVTYTYTPNDCSIGDVDGDGQWEIILKWDPSNAKDNSQSGYTGNVYLDCYELNGTRLWRINLGINIRAGAHYTQFLVGDYNADGKAEIVCKTAPGTKDGFGNFLSKGPAANDNDAEDNRNSSGYVLTGNEYLTIFNGQTGKEMQTVNFNPARGSVTSWGDDYGNRVDRFLATNAYLDGKKPSIVYIRGYYTRMAVTAWDWDGTNLTQRWYYNAATKDTEGYGQGNHNLTCGDVDGDGFDEIIHGSCAIDHNGKFMYRTGLGHGDAIHMSDMDIDNPGMEVWEVHEDKAVNYAYELHDAKSGKILWGTNYDVDNGRGLAADIDANSPGYEMWSSAGTGIYSSKGKQLSSNKPSINFRIYWDGDLQDELLDGTKLDKWNGNGTSRLFTFYNYSNAKDINGTKANPCLVADILGDWREEAIFYNSANNAELLLFTTITPTAYRLYTLMHDPVYRNCISWQNTAYNQPPHLGFLLSNGIDKAPVPNIVMTGANAKDCAGVAGGNAYIDKCGICVGGKTGLVECTTIQCEDFCDYDGISETTNTGYNGMAYINGTNAINGHFEFQIISDTNKTIDLGITYANGATDTRNSRITINGLEQISDIGFPSLTTWTTWNNILIPITIKKGKNNIRLEATTNNGLPNLDQFIINNQGITFSTCTSQTISLNAGWNIISLNLIPTDKKISTLFSGLDVQEIKTYNTFWNKNNQPFLNSLLEMTEGEGYLVKMNKQGTLKATGTPIYINEFQFPTNKGWSLLGCPYQKQTGFTSIYNATNSFLIKNFDGFWIPNGNNNSIQDFIPGKGYFLKK